MKDSPDKDDSLPRRLRMVLLHLAEEADRDIKSLRRNPARAVHAIRTRMKNLRAVLRLVHEGLPKPARKAISMSAKSLKDALAAQRDADSVANWKRKFAAGHAGSRSPGKTVIPPGITGKMRTEAARLVRLVSRTDLRGTTIQQVISAYVRCYSAGRKGLRRCLRDDDVEKLHEWRGPVKTLFYQSRILKPLDGMKRRLRGADQLGDILGKLSDLRLIAADATGPDAASLLKRVEKMKAELKKRAFKRAAKLFGSKPRKVAKELRQCVKFLPSLIGLCARQA